MDAHTLFLALSHTHTFSNPKSVNSQEESSKAKKNFFEIVDIYFVSRERAMRDMMRCEGPRGLCAKLTQQLQVISFCLFSSGASLCLCLSLYPRETDKLISTENPLLCNIVNSYTFFMSSIFPKKR